MHLCNKQHMKLRGRDSIQKLSKDAANPASTPAQLSFRYQNSPNNPPSNNLLPQIKHNQPRLPKALPLLQPLPPPHQLRVLLLPLDQPKLHLDHVHHPQHAPRGYIGDGQPVADEEVAVAVTGCFHKGVAGSDGAVHFAQLAREPGGGLELGARGFEEC